MSVAPSAPPDRWKVLAPLMVMLSVALTPIGGAIAKEVAAGRDILAIAFLRNALGALMLLAVARPSFRGLSGAQWRAVLGLGAALALMNATFYLAIARIPLGVAVAVEFLGPLGVALLGARRRLDFLWPALALAGVLLLTPINAVSGGLSGGVSGLDPLGLGFALVAGAGWAAYILTSQRTGALIPGMGGLALALSASALFLAPVGLISAPAYFSDAHSIAMVAGVALFSTLLPYWLEFMALRRVSAAIFGIMLATEPAIAALVGLVGLGEALGLTAWAAIALVCAAALGSSLSRR